MQGILTLERGASLQPRSRWHYAAFRLQAAMSVKEVKETEAVVSEMAAKNEEVFARDTALAVAKSIQGLRAVFDEVSCSSVGGVESRMWCVT